jgi:hypothetical protein
MNFGKVKAVFFILVFFLALALVVNAALGLDAKNHPAEEPAEEPEQTEFVPEPVQETPVPIPTWAPAPTPGPQQYNTAPTPAPQQNNTPPAAAPTPVPTPAPRPAGQNLGSGSFRSETGTALNIVCDWKAVSAADNKAEITLTVSIEHASIQLNDMGDNIFLRVGDQSAQMAQPIMSYDGGRTVTTVGSKTLTVPAGSSYSVALEWHYNGSYSGVPMDVIECGGSINLS